MIRVAISNRGISKPLFRPSKAEAVYSDEPQLVAIILNRPQLGWMKNVKFGPKQFNLPNVPQARPFENFWGCLAQKVYEGGQEAKTEHHSVHHIETKMKEYDKNFVESLLTGIKAKVTSNGDIGVYALFKNKLFIS